jgi:hypothetical protein
MFNALLVKVYGMWAFLFFKRGKKIIKITKVLQGQGNVDSHLSSRESKFPAKIQLGGNFAFPSIYVQTKEVF